MQEPKSYQKKIDKLTQRIDSSLKAIENLKKELHCYSDQLSSPFIPALKKAIEDIEHSVTEVREELHVLTTLQSNDAHMSPSLRFF